MIARVDRETAGRTVLVVEWAASTPALSRALASKVSPGNHALKGV